MFNPPSWWRRARSARLRDYEHVGLVALALLVWVIVFRRLGWPSLFDPDEAHYAQLTREMMRAHSWFVPLLDGMPYIDKPVLFHWLQMAAIRLVGDSELALRLPSAVAGIALVWVTRWLGATLFNTATGNVAALMFATLPLTFALANIGLFDMVYVAFLFAGIAGLIVSAVQDRPRLQYTCGVRADAARGFRTIAGFWCRRGGSHPSARHRWTVWQVLPAPGLGRSRGDCPPRQCGRVRIRWSGGGGR